MVPRALTDFGIGTPVAHADPVESQCAPGSFTRVLGGKPIPFGELARRGRRDDPGSITSRPLAKAAGATYDCRQPHRDALSLRRPWCPVRENPHGHLHRACKL